MLGRRLVFVEGGGGRTFIYILFIMFIMFFRFFTKLYNFTSQCKINLNSILTYAKHCLLRKVIQISILLIIKM